MIMDFDQRQRKNEKRAELYVPLFVLSEKNALFCALFEKCIRKKLLSDVKSMSNNW